MVRMGTKSATTMQTKSDGRISLQKKNHVEMCIQQLSTGLSCMLA